MRQQKKALQRILMCMCISRASNARGGEAGERWGEGIQIPDLDPFFAFGGHRISETKSRMVALRATCCSAKLLAEGFSLKRLSLCS